MKIELDDNATIVIIAVLVLLFFLAIMYGAYMENKSNRSTQPRWMLEQNK